MTQQILSAASDVSQSDISKIERGDTLKPTSLLALARVLQVSPNWLDTGDGEWSTEIPDFLWELDTKPRRNGVPVVPWEAIQDPQDLKSPWPPSNVHEWLLCPVPHGPRTFCLHVRGESMFNPGGRPSYSEGDTIFVDPDAQLSPGDRAIFRLEGDQKTTFKQLVEEDGRRLLKALNPGWQPRYIPMTENATSCGKVIGTWRPE